MLFQKVNGYFLGIPSGKRRNKKEIASGTAFGFCLSRFLTVGVPRRYGSAVRTRLNIELNQPPNFERLVLGCIEAKFCK